MAELPQAATLGGCVGETENRRSNDSRDGHATQPQVFPRKLQCAIMYIMRPIPTAESVENSVNLILSLAYSVSDTFPRFTEHPSLQITFFSNLLLSI